MKKSRKLLALLLALAMSLSLVACGGDSGTSDGDASNSGASDSGTSNSDASNSDVSSSDQPESESTYTFTFVSTAPSTWNPTDQQNSSEVEVIQYTSTPLWEFMMNDTKDGYDVVPSAAVGMPVDVTVDYAGNKTYGVPADATEGYAWKVELNPDLCWEDGTLITADDYIYSMQQYLNPNMSNYRASLFYSGSGAIANGQGYYYSSHVGEVGYTSTLGDLGYSTVEEAQADGYTEFGVDLDGFWGIAEAGIVSIEDETEWRDTAVDESSDEAYVSGKYVYDNYLAPDMSYASYTSDYVYVGEVVGDIGYTSTLGDLGYSTVEEAQADGYTEFGVDLDGFWGIAEAGIVSIKDETEWRDAAVDESSDEAYVSGKYVYDNYLAPGMSYASYTSDYVYVGEAMEAATWDEVGMIKNDDYSLTFIMKIPSTEFNFINNMSALYLVREDLYEASKQQAGDIIKSSYGTSVDTYMSYGPYKLVTFQDDKEMTMTKNENWFGYSSDIYEGKYQTTDIVIQYISEHSTALSLFLQGNLSTVTLSSEDMQLYGSSDYVYFSPESASFHYSYNTDLESLKSEESAGVNHCILAYKDFRAAISWAINRSDFVASHTGASEVGLGLLSYVYICDPDTGELYRDSEYAQQALCDVYGASDESQITGYDKEKAAQLFQSAYEQCLADGNISATDQVNLDYHVTNSESTNVDKVYFLQEAIDEATIGTDLEGRVTVNLVEDPNHYENMKKGLVDLTMAGFSGAIMDPYSMMEVYCSAEYDRNEYGFDPSVEQATITVNGEDITMSFNDWYLELCEGEYANAPSDTRNQVLAGIERSLLEEYIMTPVYYRTSAELYEQRIVMESEEYVNALIGFGGVMGMTYTMDDAEWAAYCAENNNQLTY